MATVLHPALDYTLAPSVNKPPKPNRPQTAADCGPEKIRTRPDAPQPGAQKRTRRYDAIANQVISAVCPGTQLRNSFADDQCFAGRFAEFLQAANDKSQRESAK